jgi:phosphoglycolate phosphatase-like HAD superfamily hydrolase
LARSRFRGVVFDLDGTIVHLPVDWGAARRELEAVTGASMQGVSVFGKLNELLSQSPHLGERALRALDAIEAEAAKDVVLVDGAERLLSAAAEACRVGLVTMQGRAACSTILDRLGVGRYFATVVTRNETLSRVKQLLLASRSLGVGPERLLFVADKRSDSLAGEEVGATVAIVGDRWTPEWGARHLRSLDEVRSLL